MHLSRRNLLSSLTTSLLSTSVNLPVFASNEPRKLGMIYPPADPGQPEEGLVMYGENLSYVIEGLGLQSMTPEGYEAVLESIAPAAGRLAERGAEAIMLMGTSLSFFKGEAFNQQLIERIHQASGLPASTMSSAIIDGLKHFGIKRVAAATAYNDDVNARLMAFLSEHGFEVRVVRGLGIEALEDILKVSQPELIEFSVAVLASAPDAEALLVSCGGLRTLEILAPIEQQTAVPVISSLPHALYAGAKLLGMRASVKGYGSLLES